MITSRGVDQFRDSICSLSNLYKNLQFGGFTVAGLLRFAAFKNEE